MLTEFSLEGKTALVTGGSRGIGRAIALVMAEAGADVAVAARTLSRVEETAHEIERLGRRSVALQVDVSDSQQVDRMVKHATQALGRVDILVNNAGIGKGGPVVGDPDSSETDAPPETQDVMSDGTWHEVLETNLSSAFYCCRAVAPQMLERRRGKVINVSSTTAILAYADGAAYQVSKAGMKMLTKVLANEWAKYNVNVNAIGPGWFLTDMTQTGFDDPDWYEQTVSSLPLGRLTDLRDLGLLAVYLASPASDWMTGQILFLDGGETALYN